MFKKEYIEHNKVLHETAAQIVGVNRKDDSFKKVTNIIIIIKQLLQPIPPETLYKFYGVNPKEGDEIVQNQHLDRNTKVFFGVGSQTGTMKQQKQQDEDQAMSVFYGID